MTTSALNSNASIVLAAVVRKFRGMVNQARCCSKLSSIAARKVEAEPQQMSTNHLAPHLVVLLGFTAFLSTGCGRGGADADEATEIQVARTEQPVVFVSIPPQQAFVRELGGDRPAVHVMVKPGRSPATYEPTPKQMMAMSSAHLYLAIGVPFEDAWMDRLRRGNPQMRVVDTSAGIELRSMAAHRHQNEHDVHDHGHEEDRHADEEAGPGRKDPHIWLDPKLGKKQARTTCDALKKIDPYNAHQYETNLVTLQEKLDSLDRYIRQRLTGLEDRTFLVFHPSWGYFAEAYDLEQVAVETEGKEPGGKALSQIIDRAREAGVKTIFVQPQFSQATAETVARAVGARVVVIDPLAADYFSNLRHVADALAAKDEPQ